MALTIEWLFCELRIAAGMCLHQPAPSAFRQVYSSYREADQGAAALQAASEGACASQKACEIVEEAAAEAGLIEGDSARLVKVPLAPRACENALLTCCSAHVSCIYSPSEGSRWVLPSAAGTCKGSVRVMQ